MLLNVLDLLKTLVEIILEVGVVSKAFCSNIARKLFIRSLFAINWLHEEFTSMVTIVCCFLYLFLRCQLNRACLKMFRCIWLLTTNSLLSVPTNRSNLNLQHVLIQLFLLLIGDFITGRRPTAQITASIIDNLVDFWIKNPVPAHHTSSLITVTGAFGSGFPENWLLSRRFLLTGYQFGVFLGARHLDKLLLGVLVVSLLITLLGAEQVLL